MANYTILLIDYEPRSIERFRDPLVGAGYGVEIATDGVSGIEAFHRLNPDMVLVEAMIPKKHGFEVCQELKRTPHGRRTPVIITTGVYKGRKYRTQALHIYGCDEYIEKPIAAEQLLEIVSRFLKPGPSGSPSRSPESGSGHSEPGGGAGPRETSAPVTKTVSSVKLAAMQQSIVEDATEGEIMACLDAILPTGDHTASRIFGEAGSSTAAVVPTAIASVDARPREDDDPFAEIRAELNSALGSLSGALDLESVPMMESVPDFIPSDQTLAPSVLEALPNPDMEIPSPPPPPPSPVVSIERPGQVVDFDSKRSRKHKKSSKQGKASASEAHPPRSTPAVSVAPAREAPAPRALEPVATVAELTLPRGTLVESQLETPVERRGLPVWLWAAAGLIAVGGLYFMFSRGTPDRSETALVPPTPPEQIASAPHVPEPQPQAQPQAPESSNTVPVAETAAPDVTTPVVVDPPKAVPQKKPADKTTPRVASTKAAAPPVAPPTRTEPRPARVAKVEHALAAPAAPSAPPDLGDVDAGVETIPDPTTAPATSSVSPGALIPIDEADTMPVSLSRKLPIYSEQAKQMRLSGTVVMNALVNEKGAVDQVVLVIGVPGADLNEAAMRAAKSWTYRPATKNGVPVKVWKSEQVVFKR